MEQMNRSSNNAVLWSGSFGEAASLGMGTDATQICQGRYPTTADEVASQGGRKRSSKLENRVVFECYFDSEPERRGYRKRMFRLWNERELFAVSEQRLVVQVRQIKLK